MMGVASSIDIPNIKTIQMVPVKDWISFLSITVTNSLKD